MTAILAKGVRRHETLSTPIAKRYQTIDFLSSSLSCGNGENYDETTRQNHSLQKPSREGRFLMFVTIRNNRAQLYSDKGALVRTLGSSGVVSADCTDDYTLLVYDSGKAELRRTSSGALQRVLATKNAVSGTINANEVVLRLNNGRTQVLRVPSGTLIRTL